MTLQLKNRVRGVSTTTGTGTYVLTAPSAGYQPFSVLTSGRQVYYCAKFGALWEVGIGTVTVAGTVTLSRDLIVESSTGGGTVNWGTGDKDVFVTALAQAMEALEYDGSVVNAILSGSLKVVGASTFQGAINTLGSVAGTPDSITGTLTPPITAYVDGMQIAFTPASTNSGPATINVNGLGARDIVTANAAGVEMALGDSSLRAGYPALLLYRSATTNFHFLNPQLAYYGYTGTLTGVNGTVTGGIHAYRDGRNVTLSLDAALTGNSNASSMSITGMPAAIRPIGSNRLCFCAGIDNGAAYYPCIADVGFATGIISFWKDNGTTQFTNGWNPSGTKGLQNGWHITYPLSTGYN